MLSPVALWEKQPVPALVDYEGRHHVVRLAVLPAVLVEDHGKTPGRGRSPGIPPLRRAGDGRLGVGPTLVVAAGEVVPPLYDETGLGQSPAHRLRGNGADVGHASRPVHGELDVLQLRHVF